MLKSAVSYASYLLRLRQVQDEDRLTWVASVQNTATSEQRWFPSLDAFVQFLQAEFRECEMPLASKAVPSEQNPKESSSMDNE